MVRRTTRRWLLAATAAFAVPASHAQQTPDRKPVIPPWYHLQPITLSAAQEMMRRTDAERGFEPPFAVVNLGWLCKVFQRNPSWIPSCTVVALGLSPHGQGVFITSAASTATREGRDAVEVFRRMGRRDVVDRMLAVDTTNTLTFPVAAYPIALAQFGAYLASGDLSHVDMLLDGWLAASVGEKVSPALSQQVPALLGTMVRADARVKEHLRATSLLAKYKPIEPSLAALGGR